MQVTRAYLILSSFIVGTGASPSSVCIPTPTSIFVHMISKGGPTNVQCANNHPKVTSPHLTFISPLLTSPRFVSSRIASTFLFAYVRPAQDGPGPCVH
ncbi:hypothetical protein ACJZ2D_016746 [Fusarium nematophilum]